jgi:small subunit ribosomal protein S6e
MKKGEKEIDKVTNVEHPNRLAPKRAGNIRKMYALVKGKDDVTKYVVRRTIKRGDKTFWKAPKVQRLVTEKRLRRKLLYKREKKQRYQAAKTNVEKYEKLLNQYVKERKAARIASAKVADAKTATTAPVAAKPQPAPAKPVTAKPTKP